MVRLTVPRSMRPATFAMSEIFPSRPPVKRARRRAIAGVGTRLPTRFPGTPRLWASDEYPPKQSMKAVTGEGATSLIRAKGPQVVGVRGTGDTDNGYAAGTSKLRDEASHAPGSCRDNDNVTHLRPHTAERTHRGLRGHAQAAGGLEADGSGFGDDVGGRDKELGRKRTVRAGLPGRGTQQANHLVTHSHAAHRWADGRHNACKILSHAP